MNALVPKRPFWIGTMTMLLVLGTLVRCTFRQPDITTLFPTPTPNGYDDFIRAADLVANPIAIDFSNRDELQTLISSHERVFKLVNEGLGKDCRVPIRHIVSNQTGKPPFVNEVARLKTVQHLLNARAKHFENNGAYAQALDASIEAYRFAHNAGLGGNAFDYLSTISRKALILRQMASLIPKLDGAQSRRLSSWIDDIENDPDGKVGAVYERNKVWLRYTYGYRLYVNRLKQYTKQIVKTKSLKLKPSYRAELEKRDQLYQNNYVRPIRAQLKHKLEPVVFREGTAPHVSP